MDCFTQTGHSCTRSYSVYPMEIEGNNILKLTTSDVKLLHIDCILTYLLTPWSRDLLEKLTSSAASQEIPHIFGTRRFITVLTSARHLSLS